jgi:ribosomal protein S18 acetylase RimI-like enzyme
MNDHTAVTRTMQPDLRPAQLRDIDAIVAIWHDGWRDAHLGHVPAELLAERRVHDLRARVPVRLPTTTVAVVGSQVAGFVVTHRDEIEQLYVDAAFRGRAVATALLDHGESVVARESRRAWLAVVAGNARARRFYQRRGWHDAGPFAYHAWGPDGTTLAVPCRRYEKQVVPPGPPRTTERTAPRRPAPTPSS